MKIAKTLITNNRIPIAIIAVFIGMSMASPYFFTRINMFNMFDSIAPYGIVAVGATFVILSGQLDISIGSVMALTACVFMLLLPSYGFALSSIIALLVGCACGAITGFFVSFFRINPFIVSMTMQLTFKGIALTITDSTPVSMADPTLQAISKAEILYLPLSFHIFIIVVIIGQFIMLRTKFGRNLYITGGNILVADNIGLNVRNHIWAVYIIQGLCAAFGGIIMLTRTFSASGNLASDALFSVIPMVIIGGTSFSGGRGSAVRTLYGCILLGAIYNAMTMFSLPTAIQQLVRGAILIIIIVSDKYAENRFRKV